MADNEPASDPAPDPSALTPPVAVDPQPDPKADPAPAADPPAADPAPATEAEPHGNAGKTPWYMKRINEETNKRQQLAAEKEAAERRAREAEELLARIQRGEKPDPAAVKPTGVASGRAPQQGDQDFEQAVTRRAAEQRFYEDTVAVRDAGLAAFPNFNDTINVLTAVGATSNEFVMDVLAVDKANAHVLFDKLAKDPERAAALASMDSRRRTAELVRLSMSEGKGGAAAAATAPAPQSGKPATVSRAPAPKPAVDPGQGTDPNAWFRDDVSDEEFSRGWDSRYKKRA